MEEQSDDSVFYNAPREARIPFFPGDTTACCANWRLSRQFTTRRMDRTAIRYRSVFGDRANAICTYVREGGESAVIT